MQITGGEILTMVSYHMVFKEGYSGSLNKCGGLPTHLPEQWPQLDGTDLTFLFQLYCDNDKLNIPNTLCIQGYQLITDGDYDSDIVVIQLPLHAKENLLKKGLAFPVSPEYAGGDIFFEEVLEEEEYNLDIPSEFDHWWSSGVPHSKLAGWCDKEIVPAGCQFLGWFADEDPFVIGAGYSSCLFLAPDGTVTTRFYRP